MLHPMLSSPQLSFAQRPRLSPFVPETRPSLSDQFSLYITKLNTVSSFIGINGRIWYHTFYNELRVSPDEHPILLTETPLNSKVNPEKIITIMFKIFSVPALSIQIQAVLSLYSTGSTTSIIINFCYGVSIVTIYEGYKLPQEIIPLDMTARDLTEWMMKSLTERGYTFRTLAEHDIVPDIKENLWYLVFDYAAEMEQAASSSELERA